MSSAKLKVFAGIALLIPFVLVALQVTLWRFDNPSATSIQAYNEWGWAQLACIPLAVAGVVLVHAGFEEYSADE